MKIIRFLNTLMATPAAIFRLLLATFLYDFAKVVKFVAHTLKINHISALTILFKSEVRSVRSNLEFLYITSLSKRALRGWSSKHILFKDQLAMRKLYLSDRPLLILHLTFASNYYGLFALDKLDDAERPPSGRADINVSIPRSGALAIQKSGIFAKLGISPHIIRADDARSLLKIGRSLQNNGKVMARIDSLPTHTNRFIIAKQLGGKTALASSLFEVAKKTNAIIALVVTQPADQGFEIELLKKFDPCDHGEDFIQSVANGVAASFAEHLASQNYIYPAWYRVFESHRMAHELTSNTEYQ